MPRFTSARGLKISKKRGPEIAGITIKNGLFEIIMKYDGITESNIKNFFSKYAVDKFSRNKNGMYVFTISPENDKIEKFISDSFRWSGKSYSFAKKMKEPHTIDTQTTVKEEKEKRQEVPKVEEKKPPVQKVYVKEEVTKKGNYVWNYILSFVIVVLIGTNIHFFNHLYKKIDGLEQELSKTKLDVRKAPARGSRLARKYFLRDADDLMSDIIPRNEKIIALENDYNEKIDDVSIDLNSYQDSVLCQIVNLEDTLKTDITGLSGKIEDYGAKEEAHFTLLQTRDEELKDTLKQKAEKLSNQAAELNEKKATTLWYKIKNSKFAKWLVKQNEEVKEMEASRAGK